MDGGETLVSRRSRRSTAGNRMAAALAEISIEDLTKDAEDDNDFVNDKDEADMFESDFESTDEEADATVAEAGEKEVEDEEKRARKSARSRLEKATKSAHVKQQVTFNPTAVAGPSAPKSSTKPKRRVSLGFIVDTATGEVTGVDHGDGGRNKRKSQRKHTMLNTSATATIPKKPKTETRALTQAELIARALDNEEGNIIEHRDYLKNEEEKRKRARVIRTTIDGPVIRWVSKTEKEKVVIQPPAPPPPPVTPQAAPRPMYTYTYPGYSSVSGSTPYGQTAYGYHAAYTRPFIYTNPQQSTTSTSTPVSSTAAQSTQPAIVTAEKNYVIHELGQHDSARKPDWTQTMYAMFGDHAQWEEVRVLVGKTRPLARPKQQCPITGKPARYLDPRTGVPFADLRGFDVLSDILKHNYVWNQALGCYVSRQDEDEAGDTSGEQDNSMVLS
ncbi:hypothetical protein BDN72DRAFT_869835 [Pluteus cervinus]|uniref:Uncharacterized protein n=1 Tax=Pluteus cervinus TaxID=181527 RepID=A0ACD3B1K9_9AGAR|nr:hypothetical protein BDN72DRAFT_869835 [Pluteus cervinus]